MWAAIKYSLVGTVAAGIAIVGVYAAFAAGSMLACKINPKVPAESTCTGIGGLYVSSGINKTCVLAQPGVQMPKAGRQQYD